MLKKTKIFKEGNLVFDVDGETTEKTYSELLILLQEYEKLFHKDEIVAYRRRSLELIKDAANIKNLLKRQSKVRVEC